MPLSGRRAPGVNAHSYVWLSSISLSHSLSGCVGSGWPRLAPTAPRLLADQQGCQKGLTGWGYLPGQWRLPNVAYPLFSRQRRVSDGVGAYALLPALLPEGVSTGNDNTAGR